VSELRLAARLREATQALHRAAESSGVMRQILDGRIEAGAYCLLARNLHALYAALERALDRHAALPVVAPIRFPALFRTSALEEDLRYLHGADWAELPLAPAMRDYVARIDDLAAVRPALLSAHAYVRYMGDLSGGQMLRDIVRRALGRHDGDGAGTAFYAYGDAVDAGEAKARFRSALDALPVDAVGADAIVAEANSAFGRHLLLFTELDGGPVAAG
jgi:heme oxygenase